MKKIIKNKFMIKWTGVILFLLPYLSHAQWVTDGNNVVNSNIGNVGIGTSTPSAKLHLSGNFKIDGSDETEWGNGITKESNAGKIAYQKFSDALDIVGAGTTGSNRKLKFWAEGGALFTGGAQINSYADIGGARNPNSAPGGLNIYDYTVGDYTNIQFAQSAWGGSDAILFNAYKSNTQVNGNLADIGNVKHSNDVGPFNAGSGMIHFLGNGGRMDFFLSQNSTGKNSNVNWETPVLSLVRGGNVGIGTPSPDAKLAVNGTIHTKEVKVDLIGWPDYVFEPTYNLKPLSEIETYIKENKHLPEVPSAKEVEKNGVQLGEMNMLLLKKIEELTLHLIKQQSMIEAQNKEIEKLKNK
jgi:hypothetical protein